MPALLRFPILPIQRKAQGVQVYLSGTSVSRLHPSSTHPGQRRFTPANNGHWEMWANI